MRGLTGSLQAWAGGPGPGFTSTSNISQMSTKAETTDNPSLQTRSSVAPARHLQVDSIHWILLTVPIIEANNKDNNMVISS